jgi:hypothetical protein
VEQSTKSSNLLPSAQIAKCRRVLSKYMEIKIKLSYITGLRPVVLDELKKQSNFNILGEDADSIYLEFSEDIIAQIKDLRSVARAYLVMQNDKYHPLYLSRHKSIISMLIDIVLKHKEDFNSFKITCAGSGSSAVRGVARYIEDVYDLTENDEADLKIHIVKHEEV